VSNEQLEQALREQSRAGERLEQTIARLGFASAEQVMRALADELAMPFVRLDETDIDDDAVRAVPPRLIFKLRAMPVRIEGGRLVVATSDPLRLDAFDQLRVAAGMPVTLVVANDDDIGVQIKNRYGVAGDVLEALGASDAPAAEAKSDAGDTEDASGASVVRLVNDLLFEAIRERATDIHIEPY
jgi:type IV pilus assembly protein PilB